MAERFNSTTRLNIVDARWCEFNVDTVCGYYLGLTYHKCRFCEAGLGDVRGLWKYSTRHYICAACRKLALDEEDASRKAMQAIIDSFSS